ncbi:MAG: hypothetical protein LBH72_02690 [Proteiniphilum sp.]|jgi:hypothetical protein|nr:hypothetical protein [Proteiniphilum sp.]
MQKFVSFLFFLIIGGAVFAQNSEHEEAVIGRFTEQLTAFPHEKLYVQTDKSVYLSGERIWFRSHMVEASSNMPAFLSRYIYVELFNPFDRLVGRVKVRPDSLGVYAGYLDLEEELPEGTYSLRAYTRYMRNRGNEAFFKKTVRVLDPYSLQIEAVADFEVEGNRVGVHFRFAESAGGNAAVPEIVTVRLPDETARRLSPDGEGHFKWNFSMSRKRGNRNLLLEIVHKGRKYNRYYPIPHDPDEFDVTFHPEGGYLVPGQACRVAFKAINSSGLSEEVSGSIFNSDGEEVTGFRSTKFGMGFFDFTPVAGGEYYAICRTESGGEKRIVLPVADARSRTLSVKYTAQHQMLVSMLRGSAAPDDTVSILVHGKGLVYFYQPWDNPSGAYFFTPDNFPSGIISILLLNGRDEVLSERLLFNLNGYDFAACSAQFSAPAYRRRQLVSLRLRVKDSDAVTLGDNIAVSVTDGNVVPRDTVNSLLSTLLLSSELKGFIESPAAYFEGYGIADRDALDALMLTQGWRRYDIPAVIRGDIALPDRYPPEKFQEISGKSEVLLGGLKEGAISLYAMLDSLYSGETTTADDKGRFMFKVEYPEGTEITVQSLSRKGGKHNLISLDPETFADDAFSTLPVRGAGDGAGAAADPDAYVRMANEEYSRKYGIRTIMLDEVTVTATNPEKFKESKFFSPIHATGLITAEDIEKRKASSLRSLLVSTPGLIVRNDKITTTRSERPVLFVIDDMNYEDFFDRLDAIDVNSIDNLFVLRDNTGMLGYYPNTEGAIVITTKGGFVQKNVKSLNIDRIRPLGYQLPAEFYAPVYETEQARESSQVDLRTTIYWKPNVQFSGEGEAVIEFYSADTPTAYRIVGEGVMSSGKTVRLEEEVTIERSY